MTVDEQKAQSQLKHLQFEMTEGNQHYQDAVTVTVKGLEMELVKILTVFTSIDLSSNNFQGPIPEELGLFKSLIVLNLSHNAFTGSIPSSVGNLRQLESLDLSMNNLHRHIPAQLANLNFLSVLNLSYNHFVGRIPTSTQLQSFSPTSFEGNEGLCGPPLTKSCTNSSESTISPPSNQFDPSTPVSSNEFDWQFFLVIGVGFGIEDIDLWKDQLRSKTEELNPLYHSWGCSWPRLQIVDLAFNYFSGKLPGKTLKTWQAMLVILGNESCSQFPVPEFLAEFPNLTSLHLSNCGLHGKIPEKLFQVPTIQTLDLSNNELHQSSLPEFPQNRSLWTLILRDTNFSGTHLIP
ncbi:hypothetical protein EZV62_016673 [Acer yangbiense]|uniref:Uncharacterized protein n=1 Tax=Acer yangbiense TaxID=1000413 RepID=A0A5C7HPT9_9ROSI|nr:hypothetical protein EZV62_016673 [Acer yangbiense]